MFSRFQGPGLQALFVSGILDSYRCIPDSKAHNSGFPKQKIQDSGFHMQKFPGFRNPDSLTLGDTMDIIYFLWAHEQNFTSSQSHALWFTVRFAVKTEFFQGFFKRFGHSFIHLRESVHIFLFMFYGVNYPVRKL